MPMPPWKPASRSLTRSPMKLSAAITPKPRGSCTRAQSRASACMPLARHLREVPAQFLEDPHPEPVAVLQHIGLVGEGEGAVPRRGPLEGGLEQDPDGLARVDGLVHRPVLLGAAPAGSRDLRCSPGRPRCGSRRRGSPSGAHGHPGRVRRDGSSHGVAAPAAAAAAAARHGGHRGSGDHPRLRTEWRRSHPGAPAKCGIRKGFPGLQEVIRAIGEGGSIPARDRGAWPIRGAGRPPAMTSGPMPSPGMMASRIMGSACLRCSIIAAGGAHLWRHVHLDLRLGGEPVTLSPYFEVLDDGVLQPRHTPDDGQNRLLRPRPVRKDDQSQHHLRQDLPEGPGRDGLA